MRSGNQDWLVSWHRPDDQPLGQRHGATGVCLDPCGALVLISQDGRQWDLPAGRPEEGETDEQTLRREMREEPCVEVTAAHLLGYSRGECVGGKEVGLILVRSLWRADVTVQAWDPQFEIPHRLLMPTSRLTRSDLERLTDFSGIHMRALAEAGIQVLR
jgi:hypothetical protein